MRRETGRETGTWDGLWRLAIPLIFFMALLLGGGIRAEAAVSASVGKAVGGIVWICTGVETEDGVFHTIREGCGFLVSEEDGAGYAVTTNDSVALDTGEIVAWCQGENIDTENGTLTACVKVVLDGDVMSDAAVLVQSEQKNYCILSLEHVGERTALGLAEAADCSVGEVLYAAGFSGEAESYSAEDVVFCQGTAQGITADESAGDRLLHTVSLGERMLGSPLLNADGYVVGLCNERGEDGTVTALCIEEIRTVLDGYGISYATQETDALRAELEVLCEECEEIIADASYKRASRTKLETSLEAARDDLTEDADAETLRSLTASLTEARDACERKMTLARKAEIVLAFVLLALFIWFAVLLSWKLKNGGLSLPVRRRNKADLLLWRRTGQQFILPEETFRIGKAPEGNDITIRDNARISRSHAALTCQDGVYYIWDLGSVNGTFVNGIRLCPDQGIPLSNGDQIAMADEQFVYYRG